MTKTKLNTNDTADDLDEPIWGAQAIGEVIKRNRRTTFYLLQTGKIDATKVGALYVSTPRRLLASLGVR
jgi:hypothetical protein